MASRDLTVEQANQRVLNYVRDRLDDRTSAGQCILHLAPGGKIKKVEWRAQEDAEDIISNGETRLAI